MKTWVADEYVLAGDLNANFAEVDVVDGVAHVAAGGFGWLDTYLNPANTTFEDQASIVGLSTAGNQGGVFATRTSDLPQPGAESAFAIGAFGINNNSAYPQVAYAGYFEAVREAGCGTTFGLEIDPINYGSLVTSSPYLLIPPDLTVGLWLASFGGRHSGAQTTTNAISIIFNGTQFASGIVFGAGSLAGNVDNFSPPIAIDMPESYSIVWRNHVDAQPVFNIRSDINQPGSVSGGGGAIIATDGGITILTQNGSAQFQIGNSGVDIGSLIVNSSALLNNLATTGNTQLNVGRYANNAAAVAAGLVTNDVYANSSTFLLTVVI